ncbi:hypothetical protein CRV15_31120 (plasmid) [Streptomyces clavuligerus]|uniref:Uncharacterized protein n=1 Tax=Streptomyces clavuligerus TaxID=1901 RepID=B5GTP2_STRCL|nr:hypothetical protein SSCG_02790 [Streptomyces clavuligerus]EFG04110.1 Hypothetical protein SCLAV_p0623 [Streptomyces clavuligerus]QCS10035.1 hypothetical protein CRV15_31120 [Streptomyces clavuligerus]QPJ97920.1 hypothetical protein GE265_33325 [Streptomyces clavuligerus]
MSRLGHGAATARRRPFTADSGKAAVTAGSGEVTRSPRAPEKWPFTTGSGKAVVATGRGPRAFPPRDRDPSGAIAQATRGACSL